ncbi:MAG: L-histidine N(alpha)-methyltransferase [Chloroflexota bacterium]|nr:L-histidine N(alpha)-methyltransferase [Chloroflexota bacterium]
MQPKELPPRWFYDERGSELFEEITRLPEYYQTRTEERILRDNADQILDAVRPASLVELGSGSSTKTRLLIASGIRSGQLRRFVPFDVSETIVQSASRELLQAFPGLTIHAVIGDFSAHLDRIPRFGRQLIIFLGSTIGNFQTEARCQFLRSVRHILKPEDAFLLGVDLVKDPAELVAAYDDAAGVTADFNLNVLRVINRELGANFDLGGFRHVARYSEPDCRIEMHLQSQRRQTVDIPAAGLRVDFAEGELMLTEISVKFTHGRLEECFAQAGLRMDHWFTDTRERFGVALAVPA